MQCFNTCMPPSPTNSLRAKSQPMLREAQQHGLQIDVGKMLNHPNLLHLTLDCIRMGKLWGVDWRENKHINRNIHWFPWVSNTCTLLGFVFDIDFLTKTFCKSCCRWAIASLASLLTRSVITFIHGLRCYIYIYICFHFEACWALYYHETKHRWSPQMSKYWV